MNKQLDLKLKLNTAAQDWVVWFRRQTDRPVNYSLNATFEYIDRYCRLLDGPWGHLSHLNSVVVPKPRLFRQACYDDWKRRTVKGVLSVFGGPKTPTPAVAHSRCYRSTRNRLREELKGKLTLWDLIVMEEGRPQSVAPDAIKESRLYKYLQSRPRTTQALRTISQRQPGGFMIIPCDPIGATQQLIADNEYCKIPDGCFGLTADIVMCGMIQDREDLLVLPEFGPVGCLGEMYEIPDNQKKSKDVPNQTDDVSGKALEKSGSTTTEESREGLIKYHFLQVSRRASIRCELMRGNTESVFAPAIGHIPPPLPA